jgi:hypothetical protein
MSAIRLSIVGRSSRVLVLGALLTLLSGALSGAPSAAAATIVSGMERVSESSPEDSLSPKLVVAYCPAGKRVIGGGGEIDFKGGDPNAAFTQLRPVLRIDGTRDAYVVAAAETPPGTTDEWELYVYAMCADPLPDMFMVTRTSSLSSSSVQTSLVGCPWVIGTGARISTASGRVVLQAVRPSGPGDRARATAHEVPSGYAGTWSLTAYAICTQTKPAGYTVVVGESAQRMSETHKEAIAQCPADRRLLSAGAAIANTPPGHVSLDEISPSSSQQRTYASAVENTPTNLNWDSIVATAICAYGSS